GVKDDYTVSSDLPVIETSSRLSKVSDFLYFVIAHEFGHIFDFANKINSTINCPEDNPDAESLMHPPSWGAISWVTNRRPKAENDFLHRSALCFYWCGNTPIDPAKISRVYGDLSHTNFLSTYATTQPWDDFADSLAYFVMDQYLDTSYV